MFDGRLSQAGNVCGNGFLLFSPACLPACCLQKSAQMLKRPEDICT